MLMSQLLLLPASLCGMHPKLPAMICMKRGLLHACSFYDPDVGDRGLRRMQRKARPSFEFVKQGVFQRQAERQRLTVSALPLHGIIILPMYGGYCLCMG